MESQNRDMTVGNVYSIVKYASGIAKRALLAEYTDNTAEDQIALDWAVAELMNLGCVFLHHDKWIDDYRLCWQKSLKRALREQAKDDDEDK